MPRKKLLSLLCVVVMAALMTVVVELPAAADEPVEPSIAWSRALSGNTYPEVLQTDLDGKVRVSSCYPVSGYQNISVKLHESGASVYDSALQVNPSVQPQACSGETSSVVDGNGNWFTVVRVFAGGGWTHKIMSYGQDEQPRWSIDLPGCTRSTNIKLHVGPNGVIYGAATCQWGTNSLFALTADASPGTNTPTLLFQKNLYMQWLFGVFDSGLIVAGNGKLEYLDLQGDATQPFIEIPAGNLGSFWEGSSTQGSIFFLHNPSQNQIDNCGANAANANGGISAYGKTGEMWNFDIDECLSIRQVRPTPDKGVVILGQIFNAQGLQDWRILSFGSAGNFRWTKEIETYSTYYLLPMAVTLSGDVVLHYPYNEAPGSVSRSVVVSVFNGSYGGEVVRKVFEGTLNFAPINNYSVALAKGRLYIGIGSCTAQCGWPITNPQVYALDIPRLEPAYPQAALLQAIPTAKQYVGLGDSYSSGHANGPYVSPSDITGCNRSTAAYPALLDADTSLQWNLTAFVACAGATTQDVINGKNGEPSQLDALTQDTKVVTITIGGNNALFEPFATACVVSSCAVGSAAYNNSQQVISTSLQGDLEELFEQISLQAPDADVYVIGYPKPFSSVLNPVCYGGLIPPDNQAGARQMVESLNNVIFLAAQNSGTKFHYVDPEAEFDGHRLCEGGTSYFIGIDFVNNNNSFHPNELGHGGLAATVKAAA